MRPIRLKLQAFGSYVKESIDFEKPNQNLFLITGDTGAGKTTIFDAIVFALYGEASSSSNKKEGVVLQSQYAALDLEPYVELVFSHGTGADGQEYTVRRVPRHLRVLTRGAAKGVGTREVTGSVSLTLPDGSEYPSKETDRKLVELVGLTKEQFMQVAMIAQGEFMELLRAKSEDKKKIFRKLFNTELYQKISDELFARKKEKEKEIGRLKTTFQAEVSHIQIPEEYEKAEAVKQLKKLIVEEQMFPTPEHMDDLKELCMYLEQAESEAVQVYKEASLLRDEKRDAYTRGMALKKSFDTLQEAQVRLEECEREKEEINRIQTIILQIRDAYEIMGIYDRCEDGIRDRDALKKALEAQQEQLPVLAGRAVECADAEHKEKELLDQEVARCSAVTERVNQAIQLLDQIAKAQQEEKQLQKNLQDAQTAAGREQDQLEQLELLESDRKKRLAQLEEAQVKYAAWQGEQRDTNSLLQEAEQLEALQQSAEQQKRNKALAADAYGKARDAYMVQMQNYERMRQDFLDAQAGFLAKTLEPGKKCPVCGSLEHPEPFAGDAAHEDLSQEKLKQLGEKTELLRRIQEEKAADAKVSAELYTEKVKSAESGKELLAAHMREIAKSGRMDQKEHPFAKVSCAMEVQEVKNILMDWKKRLDKAGRILEANVAEYLELKSLLADMEEKISRKKVLAEKGKAAVIEIGTALESCKSRLGILLHQTTAFASKQQAVQMRTEAEIRKSAREQRYQDAYKAAKGAVAAKERAEELIGRYQKELPEKERDCDARKQAYEDLLARKGMTETQWKEVTRLYKRAEEQEFRQRAEAHNHKRIAAEGQMAAAKEAIGQQPKPNPEALREEVSKAEQLWKDADSRRQKYHKLLESNATTYRLLEPKMKESKKVIQEHGKLNMLYQRISGNMKGNHMDLETFVLRYYLEKILYAANRRFRHMSAGQFELRMVEAEHAGIGKNRGLDLLVYSNVTGKVREVRTLSGGESFMAALSLALGMADQIQDSSSAVRLDMMFIDEGFGSLDDHSRNQAVKVLKEMAGGSRLIGIISHVTELKQEIENQLVVKKDGNGSHVSWVM